MTQPTDTHLALARADENENLLNAEIKYLSERTIELNAEIRLRDDLIRSLAARIEDLQSQIPVDEDVDAEPEDLEDQI